MKIEHLISPEQVLREVYGKTSIETKLSEKRRDELIAAAIFTSFRNQEFGTRFKLPADYRESNLTEDAEGIDIVVTNEKGRRKRLQIKGIHIQRSIERRKRHMTKGAAVVLGRRTQRMIRRDSEELIRIMKGELEKIDQDYSGIVLLIHVIADLATQTSLELAIKKNKKLISGFKAREIWFLRHIPVRAMAGKKTKVNAFTFELIKVIPDRQTFCFSFALE